MKQIFHIPIEIKQSTKKFYLRAGSHFSTVKQLILYYSKNTIQCGDISFKLREGVSIDFKFHLRNLDRWIIKPEDIHIKPQAIDEGSFGSIFRGVLGEKDVAVKVIRTPPEHISAIGDSSADSTFRSWEEEIEAIKILQHENIVLLHG